MTHRLFGLIFVGLGWICDERGVRGMSTTKNMIEAIENLACRKADSFDKDTSSEEILALAELVRAITILKKVNSQITVVEI